ncbi:MAG TPA: alpha/beta hydrolase [Gemmataceae bacterium]|nr:alpha/beta hydrolase [Gemmataceae bacterium]
MRPSSRTILSVLTLRQSAFWQRSWKRRLSRIMIYFAIAYVAILVVLLLLEDQFLYGPRHVELGKPPPGVEVENIELISRRGDHIHAWWSKAKTWRPEQGAVLLCHGNGGNLSHRGRVLMHWIKEIGVAVLIFDYPGYGRSSGVPSEDGCYAAGEAAYDWLCETAGVPAKRIILYGGSLGAGIATELASHRPHRALVLVASFTSFPDMAQTRFPWLPGRWLVRNRFDNIDKIANCHGPVFIAHSPQDGLIPFSQGERLFEAAPEPKRFLSMPNYHHNDLPTVDFYPALRLFLDECEEKGRV